MSTLDVSAVGSCVTVASFKENNVTKLSTLYISTPEGEEGECSELVGMRDLSMMGRELGRVGIMGSVAADDPVHRLGKEAGKSVIFLLQPLFIRIGELSGIAASLIKAPVLLLFGGVTTFC